MPPTKHQELKCHKQELYKLEILKFKSFHWSLLTLHLRYALLPVCSCFVLLPVWACPEKLCVRERGSQHVRTSPPLLLLDISYYRPNSERCGQFCHNSLSIHPFISRSLDLYMPPTTIQTPRPVVIFVTGGAWIIGYRPPTPPFSYHMPRVSPTPTVLNSTPFPPTFLIFLRFWVKISDTVFSRTLFPHVCVCTPAFCCIVKH